MEPVVYKKDTHTCIVVGLGECVNIIPLKDTGLEIISLTRKEFEEWVPVTEYSVKKAAKRYIEFANLHGASAQALRLLRGIINEKPIKKELTDMGKKKVAKQVVEEEVIAPKKSKKKKAAVEEVVAEEIQEVSEKRGRKAADTSWTTAPHIVVAPEKVKRGFLREYVGYAAGRKSFKLSDLVKKFSDQPEERITRYFSWCRTKEIFAEQQ